MKVEGGGGVRPWLRYIAMLSRGSGLDYRGEEGGKKIQKNYNVICEPPFTAYYIKQTSIFIFWHLGQIWTWYFQWGHAIISHLKGMLV